MTSPPWPGPGQSLQSPHSESDVRPGRALLSAAVSPLRQTTSAVGWEWATLPASTEGLRTAPASESKAREGRCLPSTFALVNPREDMSLCADPFRAGEGAEQGDTAASMGDPGVHLVCWRLGC